MYIFHLNVTDTNIRLCGGQWVSFTIIFICWLANKSTEDLFRSHLNIGGFFIRISVFHFNVTDTKIMQGTMGQFRNDFSFAD